VVGAVLDFCLVCYDNASSAARPPLLELDDELALGRAGECNKGAAAEGKEPTARALRGRRRRRKRL